MKFTNIGIAISSVSLEAGAFSISEMIGSVGTFFSGDGP